MLFKDTTMELNDIKQKASSLGIDPEGLSLRDLIRYIQILEGNQPCFGNKISRYCDECCFKKNCFNIIPFITFKVI
jgi:hypothetical protein